MTCIERNLYKDKDGERKKRLQDLRGIRPLNIPFLGSGAGNKKDVRRRKRKS